MRCPSCDHDNRTDRRFCTACGAALSPACPSCGAPTEPGEKFCGGCGAALIGAPTPSAAPPRPPEAIVAPTDAGERRQLTVLLCNLVGSTPLSQQLDAEEWRDVVEAYHRTTAAAVTRFGGHVAQYLGDGLLIYFGWPTARQDDPKRAIRAVAAIPASLADSLMGRLDRLSTAKEVAQRAAVLGREFGYPLLAATAGMDEAALRHGLARLVDAEILFARGEPPAATYTFKHVLIQEAAYQSLLRRTRQHLHARIAEVLEERFPERVASEPEVIARHYDQSGLVTPQPG